MKPSYTDFDCLKCIASTENQKQSRIQIADMISYFVLEVFVFDNTDVYSSMLNNKDKKNKFETIVYLIKCFKTYSGRPKIKNNYRKTNPNIPSMGLLCTHGICFE